MFSTKKEKISEPSIDAAKLPTPPRGTTILGGRGAWTSHQVWRQNLEQGPAKFTK